MKKKKDYKGFSLKLDKYFFRNLLVVLGVVMVWRGIWDLLDYYFFPGNQLLSDVLSIVIGVLILYLPDSNIDELH